MLSKLLKFIQSESEADSSTSEEQLHIAAVALLIEVAKADHSLSEAEEQALINIVDAHFAHENQQYDDLIQLAKDKSLDATSLYEFTSVINEHYSETQKYTLIQQMWEMAFSDNKLDAYEEHLIRRVADLIYLSHARFIEAKLSVKDS